MRCYFSSSVSAVDNGEMMCKENSPKIVEMTEEQKERENDAKECIHWTICKELFET